VPKCQTFPGERGWPGTSDANGLARLEDIPAGQHWFGVANSYFDLSLEPPTNRHRSAESRSGETVRMTLMLERKSGR